MRRWFLSYNSQDVGLMQGLQAGLRRKDPDARIFFAPRSLRAGGLWLPELAREIAEATAFVLLVGEEGIRRRVALVLVVAILPLMLISVISAPSTRPLNGPIGFRVGRTLTAGAGARRDAP
jgi:hypothetical protein